jgi:hypothetical protein
MTEDDHRGSEAQREGQKGQEGIAGMNADGPRLVARLHKSAFIRVHPCYPLFSLSLCASVVNNPI